MQKVELFSVLVVLVLIVSGCSGVNGYNGTGLNREHNSKDDIIKFYNIDWLSGLTRIIEELNKEHKLFYDYRMVPDKAFIHYGQVGEYYCYIYNTEKDKPLNWEIEGEKVNDITLAFVNNPNINPEAATDDDRFLFHVGYHLVVADDTEEKLREKFDNSYGKSKKGDNWWDADYIWSDINDNRIEMYIKDDGITLNYYCGDIDKYVSQAAKEYYEKKKTN